MAKESEFAEAVSLLRRAVDILERFAASHDGCAKSPQSATEIGAFAVPMPKKGIAQQQDLFTAAQFEAARKAAERKSAAVREKARAKAAVRKRGTPGIGKTQAVKNFREIADGRELLTLAEVNRIFGYNESTHGRFVKDAIRSGKLPAVKYGEKRKFVAREVRRFIDEYFKPA